MIKNKVEVLAVERDEKHIYYYINGGRVVFDTRREDSSKCILQIKQTVIAKKKLFWVPYGSAIAKDIWVEASYHYEKYWVSRTFCDLVDWLWWSEGDIIRQKDLSIRVFNL